MTKVLIVDDEAPTRRSLTRLLQQEGYEVVTASDAFEAMAAVKRARPHLMVLDVMIPPMDGLTLLMLIREDALGYELPVVVMSGLGDEQTIARARDLGVKKYLVKGDFTPQELLGAIRRNVTPETQVKA